jgi:apolipoprotein N-acyltransferase
VRLVQPNTRQVDKWAPENRGPIFEGLLDLTRRPADGPIALTVWPEVAVTFLFDESPEAIARAVAAAGDAALAVGAVRRDADGRLRNSLLLYDAEGAPLWVYDKRRLAPFGEYVPYSWVLARIGLGTLGDGLSGFVPGAAPALFEAPGLPPAAPLICYEAIFPRAVGRAAEGAGFLLQVTNDAWFGDSSGPWQHLAQARARAVEQGLPLARAANTGISAMIDAYGRIVAALPLDARGSLDSPLPPPAPPTVLRAAGDWPALALWAIAAAAVLRRGGRAAPRG